VSREVEQLRSDLVRLGSSQAADEGSAARQRRLLKRLQKQEEALAENVGRNRTQLSHLLGALQLYQRDPPPPLFVHARSARNAARAAVLMKTVTPALEQRGKVLSARTDAIRKVRRQAAAASETLLLTESEVEDRRSRIETLIAQKTTLERRLLADAAAEEEAAGAWRPTPARWATWWAILPHATARASERRWSSSSSRRRPPGEALRRARGKGAGRGCDLENTGFRPSSGADRCQGGIRRTLERLRPDRDLASGEPYQIVLAGLEQAASGAGARWPPANRSAGCPAEVRSCISRSAAPESRWTPDGGWQALHKKAVSVEGRSRPCRPAEIPCAR
jgi:hypothetical protein